MSAERTIQDALVQVNRFNSPEFYKRTNLFILQGRGRLDAKNSVLTVAGFPCADDYSKIDLVFFYQSESYIQKLSEINRLSSPLALQHLKPTATEQSMIKSMNFAREEELPVAVLLTGYALGQSEPFTALNILRGVNPKRIYQLIRDNCQFQLARLN